MDIKKIEREIKKHLLKEGKGYTRFICRELIGHNPKTKEPINFGTCRFIADSLRTIYCGWGVEIYLPKIPVSWGSLYVA